MRPCAFGLAARPRCARRRQACPWRRVLGKANAFQTPYVPRSTAPSSRACTARTTKTKASSRTKTTRAANRDLTQFVVSGAVMVRGVQNAYKPKSPRGAPSPFPYTPRTLVRIRIRSGSPRGLFASGYSAVKCPACGSLGTGSVLETRQLDGGRRLRRRRVCGCAHRWFTVEVEESTLPAVSDLPPASLPVAKTLPVAISNPTGSGKIPTRSVEGGGGVSASSSALSSPIPISSVLVALPDQTRARREKRAKNKAELTPAFLAFWDVYPRKVARAEAWVAWLQSGLEARAEQITAALRRQVAANFAGVEWDRVPHAATWLRAERWNDQIKPNGDRSPANRTLDLRR